MSEKKQSLLRRIWRDKMHVEPQALDLSSPSVSRAYEDIWQPADFLLEELEIFPVGLLATWLNTERGHLIFTYRPSRYVPSIVAWQDGRLEGVCFVGLADLLDDRMRAMLPVFNLVDHLLGSWAREGEPWLSDGAAINDRLGRVAERFARIYELNYAGPELGTSTPHEYFAHTLWLYVRDSQRLNVLDPLVYELYRGALLSESFWPSDS